MELNQKKLADKVEANHNHLFEYVDKELNTMWNELSEQVENNISDDNEGQSLNKQACLSSIQIRDAFYNAVVRSNNKIQSLDFVMRSTTDKPLSFDQTKKFSYYRLRA